MPPRPRASWDEYFLRIATDVATRATCDRKHVGAVIVRDRTILSTGYNGSIGGTPHCDEVGHMMEDGHCVATIHAEVNAVLQAARNGVAIEGAGRGIVIEVQAAPLSVLLIIGKRIAGQVDHLLECRGRDAASRRVPRNRANQSGPGPIPDRSSVGGGSR